MPYCMRRRGKKRRVEEGRDRVREGWEGIGD
jgi:hypothetical protein